MNIPTAFLLRGCIVLTSTYLTKSLANHEQNRKLYLLMYGFQFLLASFLVLFNGGNFELSITIILLGACTSLGTYCMWKAYALSVSFSALFLVGDDIISLFLSALFLDEWKFFTPVFTTGILLLLFSLYKVASLQNEAQSHSSIHALWPWALGFSIFWGMTLFGFAYQSQHQHPANDFVWSYYLGAFLAAYGVLFNTSNASSSGRYPLLLVLFVLLNALKNVAATFIDYWLFGKFPLAMVVPSLQMVETLLPLLVGAYIFKERQHLRRRTWTWIFLSILGSALIYLV